jgi:hypothetical protein
MMGKEFRFVVSAKSASMKSFLDIDPKFCVVILRPTLTRTSSLSPRWVRVGTGKVNDRLLSRMNSKR